MTFYDETQPQYLDTDMSGIGPGAALLQTRHGTKYPRHIAHDNSILRYSNIEREVLVYYMVLRYSTPTALPGR